MAAPLVALAAALSVFIGLAVGVLGGGGSILSTPLLVYVLGFGAKEAITASLFVVAITATFGVIQHARAGRVQWRTGLLFGSAAMLGAFLGGQVGAHLPGALLLAAFSVMMGVTAVAMIRGRKQARPGDHSGLLLFRSLLDGFAVGLVTGLVGAGGGFLVVPALALLGGLPMPLAVATSLLVVAMNSLAGFAGYTLHFGGDAGLVSLNPETAIHWPVVLVITAAAVIGSLVGSRLVNRLHPDRLRKAFGWFVLVMAAFMLSQQVGGAIVGFARGGWINALGVVGGLAAIAALFTWLIRRPARQAPAKFDGPEHVSPPPAQESLSAGQRP